MKTWTLEQKENVVMSNNISKNHHFIPEFYTKGFSDKNNDIYIYDVKYKKIGNKPKKAAQFFYKEHLHTVKKFGKTSVLIEDSLSGLEGTFSKFIVELKSWPDESLPEIVKDPSFSKTLVLMLSIQYWRNPANLEKAKEASKNLIDLYDHALPKNFELMPFERKDIKYLHKKQKDPAIQKFIQFLVLPLITFKFEQKQLNGMKIVKLKNDQEFICSDTPVMIESLSEDYTFLGAMLYPLTKEFALTNVSFRNLSEFDKMVLSYANLKIIASTKERLANLPQA